MSKAGYATAVIGKWHLKERPANVDYYAVMEGQGSYTDPYLIASEGGKKMMVANKKSKKKRERIAIQTKGHSSDVLTDHSLNWLENKRDKSKPFFLMHHFKAPHGNFISAPRYAEYLKDVDIPEPSNLYNQPGEFFGSIATRGVNDSLLGVIGSTVSPKKTKRNIYKNQLFLEPKPEETRFCF